MRQLPRRIHSPNSPISRTWGAMEPSDTPASDKLAEYHDKRRFDETPEPAGGETVAGPPRFVVQEHHARALHWDFRLERDGVLVSWAVPKGLPVEPKVNHLAVHTEDHPLDYFDFEGEIPAGNYGAGTVKLWDRGTYEELEFSDRKVVVVLHGERAQGRYALFQTKGDQWMVHRMDPPTDATREPMPAALAPMLATSGQLPSAADDGRYAYEIKWDGVRAIVRVDGGRLRIDTRNGIDATRRYPELRELGLALGATQCILDGEIVAFDDAGRPSFERLQRRMHVEADSAVRRIQRDVPIMFVIFDLLWLDGHLLVGRHYVERRAALDELSLAGSRAGPSWQVPAYHVGDGAALLAASREQGLEGVVAKRLDSPYEPGRRTRHWIKVKNHQHHALVVGGWLSGDGNRAGRVGALLVGYYDDSGLRYAGRVGSGFSEAELDRVAKQLAPLERSSSPFVDRVDGVPNARTVHFVEPRLVAQVAFTEWTHAGVIRHPVYKGLRDDKDPTEVRRE